MKKYKNKVSQLGNAAKVADVIYAPPPLSSSFYMYQGGTKYVYNIFCRLCINMFYVIVKKKNSSHYSNLVLHVRRNILEKKMLQSRFCL